MNKFEKINSKNYREAIHELEGMLTWKGDEDLIGAIEDYEDSLFDYAEIIKWLMGSFDLSQVQVARKARIRESTLVEIINGKRKFGIKHILNLSHALNIKVDILIDPWGFLLAPVGQLKTGDIVRKIARNNPPFSDKMVIAVDHEHRKIRFSQPHGIMTHHNHPDMGETGFSRCEERTEEYKEEERNKIAYILIGVI